MMGRACLGSHSSVGSNDGKAPAVGGLTVNARARAHRYVSRPRKGQQA